MNTQLKSGFVACLTMALSVAAYGSILGVLTSQKGLSLPMLVFMNLSLYSGSAQFVMIEMWQWPMSIIPMIIAVFVVNIRYILITASLHSLLGLEPLWKKLIFVHFVGDENWAVTMAEKQRRNVTPSFLFGGGVSLAIAWAIGTISGHQFGTLIKNPEIYALDFVFIAVFITLTIGFWRGKSDLLTWTVAAAVALLTFRFFPGKWYILSGGISGALTASL